MTHAGVLSSSGLLVRLGTVRFVLHPKNEGSAERLVWRELLMNVYRAAM